MRSRSAYRAGCAGQQLNASLLLTLTKKMAHYYTGIPVQALLRGTVSSLLRRHTKQVTKRPARPRHPFPAGGLRLAVSLPVGPICPPVCLSACCAVTCLTRAHSVAAGTAASRVQRSSIGRFTIAKTHPLVHEKMLHMHKQPPSPTIQLCSSACRGDKASRQAREVVIS